MLTVWKTSAAPADEYRIRLRDGRRIETSGSVGGDASGLKLIAASPGIMLQSRVAWSTIAEIRRDGLVIDREQWHTLATTSTERPIMTQALGHYPSLIHAAAPARKPEQVVQTQSVAAIAVRAEVQQWDADASPDGLLVTIEAFAGDGRSAAGHGELTLTLRGFVRDRYVRVSRRLVPAVVELEQAHHLVQNVDFRDGVACFKLPFDRTTTLENLDVEPTCVVHARLGLVGQGVFESTCNLLLRPWDPLVDRLPYFQSGVSGKLLYQGH